MSNFLIIGKKFNGLIDYLDSHNHTHINIRDSNNKSVKKNDYTYICDFSSIENVIAIAKEVNNVQSFNGVIATYENYILPAAQIADALNLPGLSIKSAEACTDKEIMRTMFSLAPETISPEFSIVNNKGDLIKFAQSHQFPLILKPANLAKSLLVTKADNLEQLLSNYELTLEHIDKTYRNYAPNRTPKLIIEEFIIGSTHSVDAFIDKNGNVMVLDEVVDYETGQEIGFNDNFHYSRLLPTRLDNETIAQIRHIAELGCKALGMTNSPAHIEIILSPDGPRVVEIGARNGGYRERMYKLANGIDITGSALAIACGELPNIKATKNEYCLVLELFPKEDGEFVDIDNETKLQELTSLVYYSKKAKPGQMVGKSSNGYKACAIIILHSKDKDKFNDDALYIKNNVVVKTLK